MSRLRNTGYYYTTGNWLNSEKSFRRTLALGSVFSEILSYAVLLMCVSYFAKAQEVLESNLQRDPLNEYAAGSLLPIFGLLRDQTKRRKAYQEGEKLHGSWFGEETELPLRMGERNTAFLAENLCGFNPDEPPRALERLQNYYGDGSERTDIQKRYVSRLAAYLGDTQLALDSILNAKCARNFI